MTRDVLPYPHRTPPQPWRQVLSWVPLRGKEFRDMEGFAHDLCVWVTLP